MNKETEERIKADAKKAYPVSWQYQERIGYIAGATAEQQRAQERETIFKDAMQQVLNVASWEDDPYKSELRKVVNKAIEKWEGRTEEPQPQQPEPQPDLGICVECKTRPATTDYNGHQHYVCKLCDDSLNREFDEEYK